MWHTLNAQTNILSLLQARHLEAGAEAGEVPAAGEAVAVDRGEGEGEDVPAWDRLASGQWFPLSTSPVLQCAKKIASSVNKSPLPIRPDSRLAHSADRIGHRLQSACRVAVAF